MKAELLGITLSLVMCTSLFAADATLFDEDAYFSDADAVVSAQDKSKKMDNPGEEKTLGISGELTSVNYYNMTRDFVTDGKWNTNVYVPYFFGNMLLDARLPKSVKGMANVEATYNPLDAKSDFAIRELFVDFNVGKKVYFRTGKQVLQWGRCYLWNPTDMVNVEKKTFLKKIGSRDGAYGLKMHIPFGTTANIYGFADLGGITNLDKVGGALKFELLVKNTEMALSFWGKKKHSPVAGYDIASRIGKWDISGEANCSYKDNALKLKEENGILYSYKDDKKFIPSACIDFGRSFDYKDTLDKITLNFEFFYNGGGSAKNQFTDKGIYYYSEPVKISDMSGNEYTLIGGDKKTFMSGSGIYQANYYSKYYAAVFTTVNKFIISDLALNMNLIGNIQQLSFIASAGLTYATLNDFKASLLVNGYFGKKDTEYTMQNSAADVMLTVGMLY